MSPVATLGMAAESRGVVPPLAVRRRVLVVRSAARVQVRVVWSQKGWPSVVWMTAVACLVFHNDVVEVGVVVDEDGGHGAGCGLASAGVGGEDPVADVDVFDGLLGLVTHEDGRGGRETIAGYRFAGLLE